MDVVRHRLDKSSRRYADCDSSLRLVANSGSRGLPVSNAAGAIAWPAGNRFPVLCHRLLPAAIRARDDWWGFRRPQAALQWIGHGLHLLAPDRCQASLGALVA